MWYSVCPLRRFERSGMIGNEWNEKYCSGEYRSCVRYQKEQAGIPHMDTLMPDGSTLADGRKNDNQRSDYSV